jgi:thiamine-monophosphate kinase
VASASGVAVDVDPAAFEVPDPIRDAAAALGVEPLDWILTGGEDNALAATFPSDVTLPQRWRVVGRVAAGEGITVAGAGYEGSPGHAHFGGS